MVKINCIDSKPISFSEEENRNSLELMGIKISGVDVATLKRASLFVEVKLKSGSRKVLFKNNEISLHVKPHTMALLKIDAEKDGSGILNLNALTLSFSHKLCIKNPASCLSYATNQNGRTSFADSVKDSLVDLKIKDIVIDPEGNIALDSRITAFKVIKKRIHPNLNRLNLSALEEKFLNTLGLMEKKTIVTQQNTAVNKNFNVNRLLKDLGALTKTATFKAEIDGEDSNVSIKSKSLQIRGEESPIKVTLLGSMDIDKKGSIEIDIDKRDSFIKSSFGTHNISLNTKIKHLGTKKPVELSLEAQLYGKTKGFELEAISQNAIKDVMPRRQQKNQQESNKKLFDDFNTSFGCKNMDLDIALSAKTKIKNDKSVEIISSKLSLDSKAHDPFALSHDRGIILNGRMDSRLEIEQFTYKSGDISANAMGYGRIKIKPSFSVQEKFPMIKPYKADYSFVVDEHQNARINPPKRGLTNFFSPVKNLQGNYERVDTGLMQTNIYPIGSKNYFGIIKRITGARVRKTQSAKLLIDGIQSMPERIRLINEAKDFICFQTLVFKADKSGFEYANALVNAVNRGVKVYGVVDSLGNVESLKDLQEDHQIYSYLRANGVELYLYNSFLEDALREIFGIVNAHPSVFETQSPTSTKNIHETIKFFQKIMDVLDGPKNPHFNETTKKQLARALHVLFGGKSEVSTQSAINEIRDALHSDKLGLIAMLSLVKRIGDASFRWHEKYLIADGNKAIVGGMNIADEYLMGGSNEILDIKGKKQLAWRDTDVLLKGDAACDAYRNFRRNWFHLSGQKLDKGHKITNPAHGTDVAILHHRPFEDGDHNISNFLLYNLRTLKKGEKAWFETAYFLPRGALVPLKEELMNAAKRGVDVRILTNSEKTSDFAPLVGSSIFDMRELLQAGVRIFHRNEGRMVHSKVSLLGDQLSVIGSWNFDNRSAAHDSEAACAVYDKRFTRQTTKALERDMYEQSYEVYWEDIEKQNLYKELGDAVMLLGAELV